jgi:alkaline phosphatase
VIDARLEEIPSRPGGRDRRDGIARRDVAGNFLITGQVADGVAAHTASDIPVSAAGPGASLFTGVMDNTDLFFKAMATVLQGGGDDLDDD